MNSLTARHPIRLVLNTGLTVFLLMVISVAYNLANASDAASPAEKLSANACLQQLNDTDEVVVTAAFHDGIGGFGQLKELIARNPWGTVDDATQSQLDQLIDELSPFLIVTLSKQQALVLDDHRDLIKWILVQSTDKTCK